ncbi:hypothetical protein AMATHDRAFT_147687 [Amanita thiersii Skay4041]|uniref:Uncharacterized protein n=1 Tax=Amanita thiersii Skay4041 TaxID=703135 RepID=A0A2A9NP21_9AGAR|nr:hypothetical protein AMATHDRAFT_147687 [Amanita thiersii Skay4041]
MTSPLSLHSSSLPFELSSDSRTHGYQGPSRFVRISRVTQAGGGCIARSEDGARCVVAGKESLRILRISDGHAAQSSGDYKSVVGRGGHRIDSSRNLWEGSGLKIESATTGVAWGHGPFSTKIFTSARNGELIMWDIGRGGPAKLERRTKDHIRSINQLSISYSVHHYCVTGSADGDLRIWDLRDMSKSLMRVHHPTSVRSVAFSPSLWQPLQAIVGLDNGSIYSRWDLKMGQRGLLDRLPVAHTTPVTALDWKNPPGTTGTETTDNGLGWFVSGGLDRYVKVWDLMTPVSASHIPHKPTYILHTQYPVRRLLWRPGYECEVAVISNPEITAPVKADTSRLSNSAFPSATLLSRSSSGLLTAGSVVLEPEAQTPAQLNVTGPAVTPVEDAIEIWDVRRGWISKWSVKGSAAEGGLADVLFADSHAIWAQHTSGAFSQFDLRDVTKPIDNIPRVALSWEISGSLAFVSDRKYAFEVPYDDIRPDLESIAEKQRIRTKNLGDETVQPSLQTLGIQSLLRASPGLEAFKRLAKRYVINGEDRRSMCLKNAQVCIAAAAEIGMQETAHLWLFLAACLLDVVPHTRPSPLHLPQLLNSQDGPVIPAPPSSRTQFYLQSSAKGAEGRSQKTSPSRGSVKSSESSKYPQGRSSSQSASRGLTPASSASSSPRHMPVHLPPTTPRRPSFLGNRRGSMDAGPSRRPSAYRRPSVTLANSHTPSPAEKAASSLRHVGEGALDDSDSSSGNDSDVGSAGTPGGWSDEEPSMRSALSPALLTQRAMAAPSPLSRVAGQQQWTDEDGDMNDDDGDTSASPQSTDSDSERPTIFRRQSGQKKVSGRFKSRSRSSTVASLAAPVIDKSLARRESQSSIRTIVAGDVMHGDTDNALKAEETIRDLNHVIPELKGPEVVRGLYMEAPYDPTNYTERRIEIVQMEEMRVRDIGWQSLRQALEALADQGDVQMCAMLVIMARSELGIGVKRSTALVDAYVDMLERLRLFTCSAYIRKHCQLERIQKATTTHTIIYTSCAKCRKPLIKPSGRLPDGSVVKGGFSQCTTCRTSCAICAICRLPVRTLLFQCPVCKHGGHEACYRQFYAHQRATRPPQIVRLDTPDPEKNKRVAPPSVDFIRPTVEGEQSPVNSMSSFNEGLDAYGNPILTRPLGYPCATGCGHYCWAGMSWKGSCVSID